MALSRRAFTAGILALGAVPTGALAQPLAGRRVTVIGAGMAGLSAAKAAQDAGADVVILEARDRIGGRIWTDRSLGVASDLGASWIHGARGNPLTRIAKLAGAKTLKTTFDDVMGYDSLGQRVTDQRVEQAMDVVARIARRIDRGGAAHLSIAQLANATVGKSTEDELTRAVMSAWVEFDAGAPLDQVSAAAYSGMDDFSGKDVLLPFGYDALPKFLATGLDIRLNQIVTSVVRHSGGISVATRDQSFDADFCVVTLPIGVLKAGNVAIEPQLPADMQGAIRRIGAGAVNKVVLRFDRQFWDDREFLLLASRNGRFPYFMNGNKVVPGSNVLTTYAVGNFAPVSEKRSANALASEVMAHLRKPFGRNIPDPVGVAASRWVSDPFSRCSYSFMARGTRVADFGAFDQVIDSSLVFAGEHTIPKYRSTVHGAYLSGQAAIKRILAGL